MDTDPSHPMPQTPSASPPNPQASHLEMQVVDGSERAQAVEPNAEVGVPHLQREVQRQAGGGGVDILGEAIEHPGAQQDVAILDWGDVDQHEIGGPGGLA